jgi:hypothetical protein
MEDIYIAGGPDLYYLFPLTPAGEQWSEHHVFRYPVLYVEEGVVVLETDDIVPIIQDAEIHGCVVEQKRV